MQEKKKGLPVMECKDIQKLLSPFVDNELGAQDSFIVAEHIDFCPACFREMEAIQQLDARLRLIGRTPVDGIEDLQVRILERISPITWLRRWRVAGIAAAVLFSIVLGRQIFSAPSDPEIAAFSEALIHEFQLNINQPFSLTWLDPESLQNVLHQEGLEELPNLAPAGFHLEGARICNPLSHLFLQLVYRNQHEEISLFVSKRWDRPVAGIVKRAGFTIAPLGIRAVYLVTKESIHDPVGLRQVAEEEVNALST
jgi:anti-sigma factor RsiW